MFDRLNKILKDRDRIEAFDFIRSLAALSVIFTHFELMDLYGIDIDSFFMLSGYLIAQILSMETDQINQRYFISRLTKIIPSYFFFLLISLLIGYSFFSDIYAEALPPFSEWKQYFLFYRNYAGLPHRWALEHVWTICVEEHFYFLMLFFSITCVDRKTFKSRLPYFAIALILIGQLSKIQAIFSSFAEYPTYTHNRLDVFGFGILLSLFANNFKSLGPYLRIILIGVNIIVLYLGVTLNTTDHQLILRILSPWSLSCVFIGIIGLPFHSIFRVLAYYSYNAYLWHFFIVIPIVYYFDYSVTGFVVYIVLTIMLSFLSTHLIEDFFINRRKQIFGLVFGRAKI